jgi:hypothetical protein
MTISIRICATENGRKYGDTIDEMDFPYLARVTALNVALAGELADAPPAPASVSIDGAVSSNTTIRWSPVKDAAGYKLYWRRADRSDLVRQPDRFVRYADRADSARRDRR